MKMKLGFEVEINQPIDQAEVSTTAALKTQGFGVLTRIDMRATLKEKLNVDFRPFIILGACNPPIAHQAISTDPWIGLLLPCNVTIEAIDDHRSLVRLTDPGEMVNLSEKAGEMNEIARLGHQKMAAVAAALAQI